MFEVEIKMRLPGKVNIKVKWEFYSHFLETDNLFVIDFYEASNIRHPFPKQVFNQEQRQVFRELLYSKILRVYHV
jgi:hypothetical protein